jgi:antitoxin (DNA-binding transcriptional repressor) of toxin-antitoxin stability system
MLNCVHTGTQLEKKVMLEKIGIREFRNNLAKYISATEPVAIMRHGQTVGYFLPTHKKPEQAELESLKIAAEKLDRLLAEKGITEDELVSEFRQLRRGDNQ